MQDERAATRLNLSKPVEAPNGGLVCTQARVEIEVPF
jgi:hypothetical protein